MKTLLICAQTSPRPTVWLETDSAFSTMFASRPDVVSDVAALAPGKRLFFSVPGETVTAPSLVFSVRRLADGVGRAITPAQIAESFAWLAVFIFGLSGLAS